MKASYSQTITDAGVKAFSGISGDKNPIHMNEEYAHNSRYKKRLVHGLLPNAFFSPLFGTKLPGHRCIYASQSLQFKKPIYINDAVTAIITLTEVNLPQKKVKFQTICKEIQHRVVIDGEAVLFIPEKVTNSNSNV